MSAQMKPEVLQDIRKVPSGDADAFSLRDIYTPLSVAKEEIWRRWNDKELRKKVEDFLGGDIPEVFLDKPRAVLGRHLASPNNELYRFFELAKSSSLDPLILEYLDDKFTAENPFKHSLGKMFFYDGVGKRGGYRISTMQVVDFNRINGKRIRDIKTIGGFDFVDFHHRIFNASGLGSKINLLDISIWCARNGEIAKNYYVKLFAVFVLHGVLFENYSSSKGEGEFTKNVVAPSFSAVFNKLGVKPLIVPLVPMEEEEDLFFWYYPQSIKKFI